jgi:hypothetical protein
MERIKYQESPPKPNGLYYVQITGGEGVAAGSGTYQGGSWHIEPAHSPALGSKPLQDACKLFALY